MGIINKAKDTSQSQFLVASYPSVKFSDVAVLKKRIFTLKNNIELVGTTQNVIFNIDLNSECKPFIAYLPKPDL